MKPKDLKYPFKWESRLPLLKEGIFYVPKFYKDHSANLFPSWQVVFGNHFPVNIEYCSGNGEWIINKAQEHPGENWVAVEHNFERVRKIFSKRNNLALKNLFIISGDAFTFTQEYIKQGSIASAFVNFPDPWPKKRHAKHRLIQLPFIQEIKRVFHAKGTLTLVTDSDAYSEQMKEVIILSQMFKPSKYNEGHYGSSYFSRLWTGLGRSIHFLHYQST